MAKVFTEKNLRRMVQFAEVFPDREIVVTLSRQLSWSHFVALIPINLNFGFYVREHKQPLSPKRKEGFLGCSA